MAAPKRKQQHNIYEKLRSDILTMSLRPGEDIDEQALAERYGISRTPIREALINMGKKHLIGDKPSCLVPAEDGDVLTPAQRRKSGRHGANRFATKHTKNQPGFGNDKGTGGSRPGAKKPDGNKGRPGSKPPAGAKRGNSSSNKKPRHARA